MTKIGLISDTHGYLHPKIYDFFKDCDEIWHAGDIGNIFIIEEIKKFKHFKAVYGNIDDNVIRSSFSETLSFFCEDVKVFITHIGGYPGKYTHISKKHIQLEKPNLFITGHSHILKVMYDEKNQFLYINPGASGKFGFHQVITFVKFKIDKNNISDLEIIELEK